MKPDDLAALERDFLAGILREPGVLAEVAGVLAPEDLRQDAHQRVYRAMLDLWQASEPVTAAGVADRLHRSGEVADVGGYGYLATMVEAMPTAANVVYHAGVIRDQSLLRRLWHVGQEIQRDAASPTGPAAELVDAALRSLVALSERAAPHEAVHLADAGQQLLDVLDARAGRGGVEAGGVRTGYADLDKPLAQLGPGTLTLIAGRTGNGKTTLALNIARNVAWAGSPVLFCSLEQSAEDLAEKIVGMETGIIGQRLQGGWLAREEMDVVCGAVAKFRERPLWLFTRPCQSVLVIQALARRLRARGGLSLLVVDYIGLLTPADRRAKRHEQVAEISRDLKVLAGDLGCPVLALAQLNREVDHRPNRKPQLSDLRESGALEQDADAVILISRAGDGTMGVHVAKNRRGPTQELCLAYSRETHKISNLARECWYAAATGPDDAD